MPRHIKRILNSVRQTGKTVWFYDKRLGLSLGKFPNLHKIYYRKVVIKANQKIVNKLRQKRFYLKLKKIIFYEDRKERDL